jgi:hypothetical protein
MAGKSTERGAAAQMVERALLPTRSPLEALPAGLAERHAKAGRTRSHRSAP